MKQVLGRREGRWGKPSDENKLRYIDNIIDKRFGDQIHADTLFGRFYAFLSAHDNYRQSAHYLRYIETFAKITDTRANFDNKVVVETGGSSPIMDFLAMHVPGCRCYHTETDLRLEVDCETDFADIILSFEVLEHIKDQPEKNFSEIVLFQNSGTKQFAAELARVMKPGGSLFMTTPNAISSVCLDRLLKGMPPMVFRPHVREYLKDEVLELFTDLTCADYTTMYNFALLEGDPYQPLYKQRNMSPEDRGDDHFFHFVKASTPPA